MKKVINYIKRCGGQCIGETEKSHYYLLNKKVIRVSDHIGLNSKGVMSVVIPKERTYLLWNKITGAIDNISYEHLKCIIKHFNLLYAQNMPEEKIDIVLRKGNLNQQIFDKSFFSENQIKQIESFIKLNQKSGNSI